MVSPNNDDDLMSQVFASVQLPEVKWTSESHETHEVIRKTVTVNENGEQHVHTEHYSYSNQNGGHHESESDEDEHHHHHHDQQQHQHVEQHSDNHGYHHHGGNADEDLVSQVFFNRPTVETFRVENGIPDSESASHRSSSRMSHHSHHSHHSNHSRHMSESDRESNHGGHQILVREHELENGHLAKKVLETVPYKSQQQDSIIAELKKQQSGLTDDSSDDETLKGDNDDDHHAHEEMWHHEPHEEEHIVHYDLPPQEPPRDYGSQRNSVHSEHNAQHHQQTEQANYFNHTSYAHDDNRSNRSNSVHSEANRQHAPPSHHSSHDSIPPYQPPPPPQEPATRDSRASSTSTLRSDRDIHIRTNHTPPAAPQQPIYDHTYGIDENLKNDPKGIHTVREYGTRGHRRSNASELSSVDYNRESFTVGDIEYIQEKPKPRDRTATKQSSMSYNHSHHGHHEHHDNRFRADTKQSGISQHHHQEIHTTKHFAPVKRESYTPRGFGGGQFVANVDDSPIAPVSHLANQYGGRSHGNKYLFFPHKHEEEIEKVHHHDHHSRASSKRGSDVSSVHSLKHIGNKNERSNTQHTISSQTSHGKIAHKRRDSTDSVGTQHTAVVDKHPGKYDSIRVVKNVRSYKEFLDVWSQREIEEATEEGPIHAEPIPRPRYSISARHVYPDFNSLKLVKESKQRPSIRPSETLHEHSGKVDKATSYHDLHLIGGGNKSRHSTFIGEDKSRRSTFVGEDNNKSRRSTFVGEHQRSRHSTFVPIHEEEDEESLHYHHHHGHLNGTESLNRSRKSTLKDSEEHKHLHDHENHNHEDEDYEINMHELRSVFETDNHRVKSRRASVMSTASGKSVGPIPIVPASHRQPLNHGLLYSSRRRHNRHH